MVGEEQFFGDRFVSVKPKEKPKSKEDLIREATYADSGFNGGND